MTWVTWRQHRLEGAFALVVTGLLAACIGLLILEVHAIAVVPE